MSQLDVAVKIHPHIKCIFSTPLQILLYSDVVVINFPICTRYSGGRLPVRRHVRPFPVFPHTFISEKQSFESGLSHAEPSRRRRRLGVTETVVTATQLSPASMPKRKKFERRHNNTARSECGYTACTLYTLKII